jgi:peroxiredoxin
MRLHTAAVPLLLTLSCMIAACDTSRAPSPPAAAGSAPTPATQGATPGSSGGAAADGVTATIGAPAPDFTLHDLDGKPVTLSAFRGKTVVLEWFNPNCPFVRASHTKGSLKTYAAKATAQGVVWLAINSAAPGKEGNGKDANEEGKKLFGLTHPILLDESGATGRHYGAMADTKAYGCSVKYAH